MVGQCDRTASGLLHLHVVLSTSGLRPAVLLGELLRGLLVQRPGHSTRALSDRGGGMTSTAEAALFLVSGIARRSLLALLLLALIAFHNVRLQTAATANEMTNRCRMPRGRMAPGKPARARSEL